jgi:hypothetical protein
MALSAEDAMNSTMITVKNVAQSEVPSGYFLGLGRTTKYFGVDSHFPSQYFNPGHSEYEAGAVMLTR